VGGGAPGGLPFQRRGGGGGRPAGRAGAGPPGAAAGLGRVEPLSREIRIAASVPGRIAEVLVRANDKVFAGELLVRLDDEEAAARVAAAEARVALAKRARNDQSTPAASADRPKPEHPPPHSDPAPL